MSQKSTLQPVRGTHDWWGDEYRLHTYVSEVSHRIARLYGYEGVATPIFEYTAVFRRNIGETSDIVTKEMYTFEDRGGEEITLRPEGTASVMRGLISEGLTQTLPQKVIYDGPMFRYERPQKGRLRQFHQVGVELIGVEDPLADVETIALGYHILQELGLAEDVVLEINTLGDKESRKQYRTALVEYLSQYKDRLSKDSLVRLEQNPLRIFDSKDEGDQRVLEGAPDFNKYLSEDSKAFFQVVCDGLEAINIPFVHNKRLVRGLDYYTHTAFEFTTNKLGAQGTVLAGGRYDGLVAQMGGPDLPGVGWAAGIERLASLMSQQPPLPPRPLALIPLGEAADKVCFSLAQSLRKEGIPVHLGFSGNLNKRMKKANAVNASKAILIGDNELASGEAIVKDLDLGTQESISLKNLKTLFSGV